MLEHLIYYFQIVKEDFMSSTTQNLTDGMHIMIDALKKNNITTILGVIGIPVTDLFRQAQKAGIRYIGFRHE